MTIERELAIGKPNSLGKTEQVVRKVLKDPALLPDLFATLESENEWVRMRAGDAVEKIFREKPELAKPHMRDIFAMSEIDQPSLQWHFAQIVSEVPLSAVQRKKALDTLKRTLKHSDDWIVLNVTMQVLSDWSRSDAALNRWLKPQLERLSQDQHASVRKRATKLLALA